MKKKKTITFPYKPAARYEFDGSTVSQIISRKVVNKNVAYHCKMADGTTKYVPAAVFSL